MGKYYPRCGKHPGAVASRKQVLRSARCARGGMARPGAAPGFAALRLSRLLRGCGRAVVAATPDHAAYGGCRECGFFFCAAGRRAAAVSPALVSPPASPFRRRPFRGKGSEKGQEKGQSLHCSILIDGAELAVREWGPCQEVHESNKPARCST